MPTSCNPDLSAPLVIPKHDSWPETKHRFDEESVWAVRAAIAAGRPLLLRGEPGIGKSQLARAAAVALDVPFLYHVVDERSERDDLLLTFDAISRLAEAQVSALTAREDKDWRDKLAELNFIRPGVLWWAFNWTTAKAQAERFSKTCRECDEPATPPGWTPDSDRLCGPVVLVDEIDKADPSVPNGLLECLGNQGFRTNQLVDAVSLADKAKPPLVIITTNEERELPTAFLRRCLVLQMRFPKDPATAETFLIQDRARVRWNERQVSDEVCRKIVGALLADRETAARLGLAIPGAAEFLDIISALVELSPGDEAGQLEVLDRIKDFALKKNLDEAP
jgi:MoxR-like ATPase